MLINQHLRSVFVIIVPMLIIIIKQINLEQIFFLTVICYEIFTLLPFEISTLLLPIYSHWSRILTSIWEIRFGLVTKKIMAINLLYQQQSTRPAVFGLEWMKINLVSKYHHQNSGGGRFIHFDPLFSLFKMNLYRYAMGSDSKTTSLPS